MKIKNIILVVEFILILIMGCVSFNLIKDDLTKQSTTVAEEETLFDAPEELGIAEVSSSDMVQANTSDGTIILADEISPDTCRFWDSTTHEKLDKDRFRRDMGGVEEAYQEIMKRLMGE